MFLSRLGEGGSLGGLIYFFLFFFVFVFLGRDFLCWQKMKRNASKRDASVSVGRDTNQPTKVLEFVKLILGP